MGERALEKRDSYSPTSVPGTRMSHLFLSPYVCSISLCLSVMGFCCCTQPPNGHPALTGSLVLSDQEPVDTVSVSLRPNSQERDSIPRSPAYGKLHLIQVLASRPISYNQREKALNYKMTAKAIPSTGAMRQGWP